MKLKVSKYSLYKDKTGGLAPFYIKGNLKNFKIKRFFLFMEIKNIQGQTMHIKNVVKY